MPPNAFSHSLPLPRGWPRRVRSAVVQVISLARASLTMTRGWASNSMNPRLRRQAEADRLQEEIQLLREEIRIKDARMEHIEAQKRPYYPPTERLAILELRAARGWSLPPERISRESLNRRSRRRTGPGSDAHRASI